MTPSAAATNVGSPELRRETRPFRRTLGEKRSPTDADIDHLKRSHTTSQNGKRVGARPSNPLPLREFDSTRMGSWTRFRHGRWERFGRCEPEADWFADRILRAGLLAFRHGKEPCHIHAARQASHFDREGAPRRRIKGQISRKINNPKIINAVERYSQVP